MSRSKTAYLNCDGNENGVKMQDAVTETVKDFKYLGSTLSFHFNYFISNTNTKHTF